MLDLDRRGSSGRDDRDPPPSKAPTGRRRTSSPSRRTWSTCRIPSRTGARRKCAPSPTRRWSGSSRPSPAPERRHSGRAPPPRPPAPPAHAWGAARAPSKSPDGCDPLPRTRESGVRDAAALRSPESAALRSSVTRFRLSCCVSVIAFDLAQALPSPHATTACPTPCPHTPVPRRLCPRTSNSPACPANALPRSSARTVP